MTTKPKTSKAPGAPARKTADDPIFALIAEHKALAKKRFRLSSKLDEAESEARETHGLQPPKSRATRGFGSGSDARLLGATGAMSSISAARAIAGASNIVDSLYGWPPF